jgi:hypothetical protein
MAQARASPNTRIVLGQPLGHGHCAPGAQPRTGANALAARGTGTASRWVGRERGQAPLRPPPVGRIPPPGRRVAAADGSTRARAGALHQCRADARADSPGVDVWPPVHATDTGGAADRSDNPGCGPHNTTLKLPSASRRCSVGESVAPAGQCSVPLGWRAKSRPEKRPCCQD